MSILVSTLDVDVKLFIILSLDGTETDVALVLNVLSR